MIFDSDVLVWFLRGDAAAGRAVDAEENRRLSIISLMEVVQGAKSKAEVREFRQLLFVHDFEILPISEDIGFLAASLMEQHSSSHGLQLADALIAATATLTGEAIITGNVRHFRSLPALQLKAFRRSRPENGG